MKHTESMKTDCLVEPYEGHEDVDISRGSSHHATLANERLGFFAGEGERPLTHISRRPNMFECL